MPSIRLKTAVSIQLMRMTSTSEFALHKCDAELNAPTNNIINEFMSLYNIESNYQGEISKPSYSK